AGQINGAMQQLDQVTQQNAAASEQLAATAQEMRGQSQALLEMISFFRLFEQGSPVSPVMAAVVSVPGSEDDAPEGSSFESQFQAF
ncbi:MAG: methyl-accepting chemotaxis protein, partial [Gammaproteobacteria bacterium]|nr:methyl-accepting chemotaxis protein [Gammaproteobacteria bacterium]